MAPALPQSADNPCWRSGDAWMLAAFGRGSAAQSAAMGECGGHFWAPALDRGAGTLAITESGGEW
jgi:hypothetical protein